MNGVRGERARGLAPGPALTLGAGRGAGLVAGRVWRGAVTRPARGAGPRPGMVLGVRGIVSVAMFCAPRVMLLLA